MKICYSACNANVLVLPSFCTAAHFQVRVDLFHSQIPYSAQYSITFKADLVTT